MDSSKQISCWVLVPYADGADSLRFVHLMLSWQNSLTIFSFKLKEQFKIAAAGWRQDWLIKTDRTLKRRLQA